MKKNVEYCVFCGTKNKIENKKCIKCQKKLNPKDRPLLDYMKSKIKDNLKGNIEDNIIDIITKYIKSHLYGFIMTCSIIITSTCIITNVVENNYIENVIEKPLLVLSTTNNCIFDNSIEPINICNENYILKDGICIKEEELEAIQNKSCPVGYYQSGNSCISNITYDKLTKEECLLPNDGAYEVYISPEGECVANYCNEWTDGECASGSGEPIDYTITEYCPDGTSSIDGSCKKTSNLITNYSCEEGTLNNNKCMIITEEEPMLGCLEGYSLDEECNVCTLEEQP